MLTESCCHNPKRVGVLIIEQRRRAEGGLELGNSGWPLSARNLTPNSIHRMGNMTGPNQDQKSYRVILFILVALVALSSAMSQLNQLRSFTFETVELIAQWSDVVAPSVMANSGPIKPLCAERVFVQEGSDEFRWTGTISQGGAVEIKGVNGQIRAEPSSSNQIEVQASKRSRRSDVNSVQIKVVEHAGGVTICTVYPSDDASRPNTCEPGEGNGRNSVRNNDVTVDFTVRVPNQVALIARTVNGEITANSLTGNVTAQTVNGSIKLSTTGYAEATTINGGITARVGDANWPSRIKFSTLNGGIDLDLPSNISTEIEAQTTNGSIHSDFPLTVSNLNGPKKIKGKIGSGGRELILQTLNGSISLRAAG